MKKVFSTNTASKGPDGTALMHSLARAFPGGMSKGWK